MRLQEFLTEWQSGVGIIRVQTSGSTGSPKLIELSRSDMIESAMATNAFFGLSNGARFVCPMDFKYIGAKMMAVRACVCNGEVIEIEPSNDFDFDGIADLLAIVPSQVECVLRKKEMHNRIRNLIIGGGVLKDNAAKSLIDTGINAYTTYGMTETASHIALARVGEPIYKTLPGIYIENHPDNRLIINMRGRTKERIITNDIVTVVSPTEFIWQGRIDNVINTGGVKINPLSVECLVSDVLKNMQFDFVDVVCVGIPSDKWGEKIICIVETPEDLSSTRCREIISNAKETCAEAGNKYAYPKHVLSIKSLPRTANGKIDYTEVKRFAAINCTHN